MKLVEVGTWNTYPQFVNPSEVQAVCHSDQDGSVPPCTAIHLRAGGSQVSLFVRVEEPVHHAVDALRRSSR